MAVETEFQLAGFGPPGELVPAQFLTEPLDRKAQLRCYLRDPDGYLIEVGQSTGLLKGHLAKKRPEDLPG